MKKILAFLLVISCMFACAAVLTACGDDECTEHVDANGDNKCDNCEADVTPEPQPPEDKPPVVEDKRPDFVSALAATVPTETVVTVTTNSEYGKLTSVYTTVYAEDGSFTINYSKQSYNLSLDPSNTDDIITETGTITCSADGNYSDGGSFAGSNPAATGVKINISSDKLDYVISDDILTATVSEADTREILGNAYAEDATVVIIKNNGKIISASVTIGDLEIVCEYK